MTDYGLTPAGFVLKPLSVIKGEIEAKQRAEIDPNVNTSSAGPVGQINGIVSSKIAELWELLQAVNASTDRRTAVDRSLDALGDLTGTEREAPKRSTVVGSVTLTAGTTLAAGHVASVTGTGARFRTTADITNPSGITDDFDVALESEDTGAIAAPTSLLTTIATPAAGWLAITNAAPAILGAPIEKDPAYRVRQVDELAAEGGSTTDATRADLLKIEGVRSVTMFENRSDATDGAGLPPHSFEACVLGTATAGAELTAENLRIANSIWSSKPAGIETHGTTAVTVLDAAGNEQVVNFTRPTVKTVYLEYDVEIDDLAFPSDGDTELADALEAQGAATLGTGDDVILRRLDVAVFSVPGVDDVIAVRAGFTASPVGTANLAIAAREIAEILATRVVVNHV